MRTTEDGHAREPTPTERQLRFVTDHAPVLIVHCDADARYLFVNAPYATRFGLSPDALVGRTIADVLGEPAYESIRRHVEAALRGQRVEFEEEIPYQGLGKRWMHVVNVPDRRDDGTVAGFVAVIQDITARKLAEGALQASEERYRSLLRLMPAAVYTCEAPSGAITFYNEQAARLWGRSPRIGETDERFCGAYRLWRPDGSPLAHADTPMALALREGREFRNEEVQVERPDGSRITALVNIDPLRNEQGRVTGAVNVFVDMTELKEAQAKLREADRRKDEFLATLSHELRNPLAPLRNCLNLLRLSDADEALRMRDIMERQLNHLVRVVDDLLEVSRISSGALELRKEPVALDKVVRHAVETSEPLIREARHELAVAVPPETLWLEGDPVRLSQILANLLNNAAQYTPPGGRIALRVERSDGEAVIRVQDNGSGIEPEELSRLFEMFTRASRSRASAHGGLGIGLALARRLAEMHGGGIEARSDGPDKGSEFIVRLPLAAQAQEPAKSAAAAPSRPRRRVLVVDDNRDAADSLGMILRHLGSEVLVARDGPEALGAFERYAPEVVLLDIGMPGMDGYEVARRIRGQQAVRRSVLVALTGWGQEEDRRRAREAGFDHHLIKPAEVDALQRLLAGLP